MKTLIVVLITVISVPCNAQWKYAGSNIQIIAFGIHDTSLFVSYVGHMGRVNPTGEADTGINFSYGNVSSFASLGQYFFANIGTGYSFRTSNDGSSWQQRPGGKAIATNGRYLFARYQYFGYGPYMSVSRDSGNTWDSLANFDPQSCIAIGTCIFANTGGTLQRSLDTGARGTWSQLTAPFLGTMVTMGTRLFMYQNYRSFPPGNGVLLLSKDSGMTWDTVHVDSAGMPEYVTTLATDGKNLFAGGVSTSFEQGTNVGNGVYVSTDTGKHWRAVNDGLTTNMNIEAMCVYDTFLYISTNNNNFGATSGISYATYYRPIHEITDTTPSSVVQTLPPGDTIEIYPNPATGIVSVMAGGTSILAITVLNVLGENVLVLPNLRESDISLDLSKLPSGTYFLQIQSTRGTVIRKIVINR